MEGRDAPLWRCPRLPPPEARSPPRRADWAVRIQVPVREGGAGSSSSAAAHRGAPTAPLSPGRAVGSVAVGAQPGTAPALPGPRSGCAGRPGGPPTAPALPGPRCPVEAVGVDPRRAGVAGATPPPPPHPGAPIRAPPSGRPSRPGCSVVDIVGVPLRTRIGSELEGLPAQRGCAGVGAPARPRTARRGLPVQRGRGRFGGRRCTRDRRHTRPVRPVRLNAGAGGSVAERPGHSKRWPARIFHPPPRAPPIPKWRNDAIPHERRSRRAPERYAPSTFFRPADAPGRNGGAAGGLHRARTVIDTGPDRDGGGRQPVAPRESPHRPGSGPHQPDPRRC